MAEFIEILSPSALKDLREANLEVVKLVANIDKVGQNMAKISTPSGADNATKKLVNDYQNLEKQLQKTQQQLEKQRLSEIKLQQDREKAFDKYQRQSAKELEQVKKVSGLYNQAQIKVRELTEMYNDLAIKKQFGQQLTVKEQAQLAKLTNELNIYQTALKKVDADIQKNQRNVGNYASSWNGLGNSVSQLTREMPAFANSAQTGFMAISNNLPILFDEITRIKDANKELIAQGKPIQSLGSQIAGAFFSWGTALSVGVTLLTIFAPKLWDLVSSSKATKEALEKETKAREEKARIEKEAYEQQVKYASDEQAKAKILLETAKNITLSMSEREKAVKELQSRYPDYLGSLSKEKILAGDTAEAEYKLNDALMKRAMFLALQDKIIETTKKVVDAEMEYVKTNKEAINTDELYDANLQKKTNSKQKYRLVNEQDLQTTKGLEAVTKSANKENITSTSIYNEKTLAVKKQLDVLYSLLNGYAKYANVVNETNNAEKKSKEEKRQEVEAVKSLDEKTLGLVGTLKALKTALEQQREEQSKSREDWIEFTKTIDVVQSNIDHLTKGYQDLGKSGVDEFLKRYSNQAKQATTDTEALRKATDDWIDSFKTGFFSDAGLPTLFKVLNNEIDGFGTKFNETFLGITQIAQEALQFLNQANDAYFQRQYERLEQQRDIAILFAGESVTAQQEIQDQYEQRRRRIQRQQAETEKRSALFNVAVNTAQAIVATLAKTPLPAGLPFVIATSAIGALQAGLIASQPIPAFAKGTDNAPEGWALTQEQGREIITDKYGKIKSLGSDKGAQYTYLNKGDKVFKNADTEAMLFNSNLNNMLLGNGIAMPKVEVSMDTAILGNKIDNLTNTIANKEGLTIVKDERGERKFIRKQNETKELLNNVLTYKGIDV